jgi:hypothetical protein
VGGEESKALSDKSIQFVLLITSENENENLLVNVDGSFCSAIIRFPPLFEAPAHARKRNKTKKSQHEIELCVERESEAKKSRSTALIALILIKLPIVSLAELLFTVAGL